MRASSFTFDSIAFVMIRSLVKEFLEDELSSHVIIIGYLLDIAST